ncbi:MAG: hypothetical protein KIT74_04100 [Fimbriimonadales bacterium]|nr:hypothetical protein [Fimbriimonadales bacterium]
MANLVNDRHQFLLAATGVYVAGVLSFAHVRRAIVPCGVGSGCNELAYHPSAKWFGVPVAVFGLAAFVTLALIIGVRSTKGPGAPRRLLFIAGYGFSAVGTFVSLWLTGFAVVDLKLLCSWCLASGVLFCLIFLCHTIQARLENSPPPPRSPRKPLSLCPRLPQ